MGEYLSHLSIRSSSKPSSVTLDTIAILHHETETTTANNGFT